MIHNENTDQYINTLSTNNMFTWPDLNNKTFDDRITNAIMILFVERTLNESSL